MAIWTAKRASAYGKRACAWHFFALLLVALTASAEARLFVTWKGIGPDKWASAWLLQRHIDPSAEIRFIAVGKLPVAGIPFDIPEIPPYIRDSRRTTYESLLEGYSVSDPALIELGQIVRDIEELLGHRSNACLPVSREGISRPATQVRTGKCSA